MKTVIQKSIVKRLLLIMAMSLGLPLNFYPATVQVAEDLNGSQKVALSHKRILACKRSCAIGASSIDWCICAHAPQKERYSLLKKQVEDILDRHQDKEALFTHLEFAEGKCLQASILLQRLLEEGYKNLRFILISKESSPWNHPMIMAKIMAKLHGFEITSSLLDGIQVFSLISQDNSINITIIACNEGAQPILRKGPEVFGYIDSFGAVDAGGNNLFFGGEPETWKRCKLDESETFVCEWMYKPTTWKFSEINTIVFALDREFRGYQAEITLHEKETGLDPEVKLGSKQEIDPDFDSGSDSDSDFGPEDYFDSALSYDAYQQNLMKLTERVQEILSKPHNLNMLFLKELELLAMEYEICIFPKIDYFKQVKDDFRILIKKMKNPEVEQPIIHIL